MTQPIITPSGLAGARPRIAYTIKEAAGAIGIGRTTLYGLIRIGDLPIVKIGKRTLIRHNDLVDLISKDANRSDIS